MSFQSISNRSLFLFAFLPGSFFSFSAQASCFWPDGSTPKDGQGPMTPCGASGNSTCCVQGDGCLSNGLCFGAGIGMVYRGACTDQSWTTLECPIQYCQSEQHNTWSNLWRCPPTPRTRWWCGNESQNKACAEGGGNFFTLPSAVLQASTSTVTQYVGSATGTATAWNGATSAGGHPGPGGPNVQGTSTASNTTPTAWSGGPPSNIRPPPIAAALGAAIGVPMGIAVFGLLGFLFYRERSRRPASTPTEQGREEQGREKAVRDPARMSVQEILGVERIQPQEMNAEERNA